MKTVAKRACVRRGLYINWDFIFNHLRDCKYCQSFQPCGWYELSSKVFEHATCDCNRCKTER